MEYQQWRWEDLRAMSIKELQAMQQNLLRNKASPQYSYNEKQNMHTDLEKIQAIINQKSNNSNGNHFF